MDNASPGHTESTLVSRVAAGDADALGVLYDLHGGLCRHIARRLLGDEEAAREVVQDVFVDLWRNAGRFDPARSSVTAWVARSARARSVDRLRRESAQRRDRGRDVALDAADAVPSQTDDPHASAEERERRDQLHAALERLPAEQRVLVRLAFLSGYSHAELAAQLGLPTGTVKTRLFRGLAKLRELLEAAPVVERGAKP